MKLKVVNPDPGRLLSRALAACLIFLSASALAQESAHEYRADGETTIETIDGLRVITLRQNVFVRQNQVELTGDVAVLEYNLDNELQQVRLTGSPANFQQQPDADAPPITGFSDTIIYNTGAESIVEFIGSANFNQPGTTLQCAEIRHTIETGATSGQACSGSLTPQNGDGATATPGTADTPNIPSTDAPDTTTTPQTDTGTVSPQPN